MAGIRLDNVSLTFQVRRQQDRLTLKEYLVRGLFFHPTRAFMEVRALQEVSLRVLAGERVGIVGHNGAGKSTLLKLLAGIYQPTRGELVVEGAISSLFDIALGFEPDATGWENIYYRGYLQGETPRTIGAKIHAIAEFTELGEFLKMPVRYYSAGMMVRLAFAIATAVDPEVLLIDEVLSVGDMAFQEKARQRMRQMMARAKLMVVVSHDLTSLASLCDRGLWIDHGRVCKDGPIDEVIAAYTTSMRCPPAQQPVLAEQPPFNDFAEDAVAGPHLSDQLQPAK
jgi:ABC-type polysaccharide/polyol phosphate transport system ATPase subunit